MTSRQKEILVQLVEEEIKQCNEEVDSDELYLEELYDLLELFENNEIELIKKI